jgi:hypothetical protein
VLRDAVEETPEAHLAKVPPWWVWSEKVHGSALDLHFSKGLGSLASANGIPCLASNQILVVRNGGNRRFAGCLCGL